MTAKDEAATRVVFVTGASGAGRTTAIHALEDAGFEVINNLPLSLLERVLGGPDSMPPLALGIDVRNRDFSQDAVTSLLDRLTEADGIDIEILFLDCDPNVVLRRYSETRRRHPMALGDTPQDGIAREMELLRPVKARADHVIDTSDMTPHDLRAEIERRFVTGDGANMVISVQSFSYKRGLPRGVDLVFDVRFLANPHWEKALRAMDGRDAEVARFVESDPLFTEFFTKLEDFIVTLLPAYKAEGKSHFAIALGCTGGQHRSVAVTEKLANALAEKGWQVSTRHREIERRESK